LNQLGRKGFSTKGEGRGTGLYNMSQLITKNKNLSLQTEIKNGKFIQKLNITPLK
jgi:two-component system sensor histidine kinase AgrC